MIYISRRTDVPLKKAVAIKAFAILLSLVVCALVLFVMTRLNPLDIYIAMFKGSFSTQRKFWALLQNTAILLCISLAVTPAFKMKFWNLGAEGQVLIGALVSATFMFYIQDSWPSWLLILVMLVASVAAGLIWAGIPGYFKARFGTNETLFTLMMNYIATFIVSYYLMVWTPSGSSTLGMLSYGYLPSIVHNYFLLIVTIFILAGILYVYLNYSKLGYEISVVGESRKTALYIGIDVRKVIIRTMTLSGMLCGFAGFLIVSALDHSVTTASIGGRGFTASMVSWLAKFNPITMIGTSFLITFLDQGAAQMSTDFNIDSAFPDVIVGIIIFFIIGCEFFIFYKMNFRKGGKEQ